MNIPKYLWNSLLLLTLLSMRGFMLVFYVGQKNRYCMALPSLLHGYGGLCVIESWSVRFLVSSTSYSRNVLRLIGRPAITSAGRYLFYLRTFFEKTIFLRVSWNLQRTFDFVYLVHASNPHVHSGIQNRNIWLESFSVNAYLSSFEKYIFIYC